MYVALSAIYFLIDQFGSDRLVADSRLREVIPQWTAWQWLVVGLVLLLATLLEGAYREGRAVAARAESAEVRAANLAEQVQALAVQEHTYEISPTGARSVPHGRTGDYLVELQIRNDGAKGEFAVTLESIDGVTEPYVGHAAPVQIGGREGRLSDVLAKHDVRRIGVAIFWPATFDGARRIVVWPIDPNGAKRSVELVTPEGDTPTVTLWVKVTLIGDMNAEYSRTAGVEVVWPPGLRDPHIRPMFDPVPDVAP